MLLLHQPALYTIKTFFLVILASEGFEPSCVVMKTLCLRPLDYKALFQPDNTLLKPSASIALASAGYKTATLLLC